MRKIKCISFITELCILLCPIVSIVTLIVQVSNYKENVADSIGPELSYALKIVPFVIAFIVAIAIRIACKMKAKKQGLELKGPFSFFVKHKLVALGLFFIVLLTLGSAAVYFIQNRLLFYPNENYGKTAELKELKAVSSAITKVDNNYYHGWQFINEESDYLIIYFGGNGECSSTSMSRIIDDGILTDSSILVFDYPGYGTTKGNPSEESIFEMADAVLAFAEKKWDASHIRIIGYSLGTGVASYIGSKYDVNAIALIAPYDNMTNEYNSYLPIFHGPFKWLVRNHFTSDEYAKDIDSPVLIIASTDDEVVPVKLSENLYEAFNGTADFTKVNGLSHNDIISDHEVNEMVQTFFTSLQ